MGRGLRIGAAIGVGLGVWEMAKAYQANKTNGLVLALTGYDMNTKKFNAMSATAGLPMAVGIGVSLVAAKTGINRYTPKGINL